MTRHGYLENKGTGERYLDMELLACSQEGWMLATASATLSEQAGTYSLPRFATYRLVPR